MSAGRFSSASEAASTSATRHNGSPSIIVEFSGIPGSGKSFLAHQLVAVLRSAHCAADEPLRVVSPSLHPVRRVLRKLRIASIEVLTNPVSAGRLVVAIARSGQPLRDLVHRSQDWLVTRALFRRARHRAGVHVFDQGIVQELCSIGYRGRWRNCLEVAAPGRADLAPDLIVRVTAPIGTAQRRLCARPGIQSRVESLDELEMDRALRRQDLALDDIERAWFDQFGKLRGTRRLEVDNGATDARGVVAQLRDEFV